MRRASLLLVPLLSVVGLVACGGEDEAMDVVPLDQGRAGELTGGSAGVGGGGAGGVGGTGGTSEVEVPKHLAPYPEGPYGDNLGSVIANHQFIGWSNPAAVEYDVEQMEPVWMSDFYDPDGSKNIKLLMINSSAQWCPPCRQEYRHFQNKGTFPEYRAKGVMFLGSLMENNAYEAPRYLDARAWVSTYKVDFPFVIDTSFKLGGLFTMDAIPNNTLIDTKTMKVIRLMPGGDTDGMLRIIDTELQKRQ